MMRIVIVGAGVIGVTTAYFLAKAGHSVTVLDRASDVALETSFANGGILTPSMADPWNAPGVAAKLIKYLGREDSPLLLRPKALPSLLRWGLTFVRQSTPKAFRHNTRLNAELANYSMEVLRDLRRQVPLNYDRGPGGTLKICRDPQALEAAVAQADYTRRLGVVFERLDATGVVAREPALAAIEQKIAGGIIFPEDESGDAHLFTRELATAAEKVGVVFEFGVTVTGFNRVGRRASGVVTSVGNYAADAVVLAAGSYTPGLAKAFGVRVPVKPVKGYSITVPAAGWGTRARLPVTDDHYHAVVTPLGDRLRVGGTAEFAGFDKRLTPSRIDNLKAMLLAIYPTFAPYFDQTAMRPWTGFRPMSADGVPIMGRTAMENVYLNTGHGHLGWTMAAGAGRHVAAIVSGETPRLDPAPYGVERFSWV